MAKTIFSGVWRADRATALILGLAVMLALVVGVATAAFGANHPRSLLLPLAPERRTEAQGD